MLEQSAENLTAKVATLGGHGPTPRLFTVAEYDRMIEAGIFDQSERVELIQGRILTMSPKSVRHAALTDAGAAVLSKLVGGRALVRNQNPIRLTDGTEPEPDLVIAQTRPSAYFDRHPEPKDILLVAEVADSSLSFDRNEKSLLYACAGILQYLVLNARDSEIEDHREPSPDGYRKKQVYRLGQRVHLAAFPDVSIGVDELFPASL